MIRSLAVLSLPALVALGSAAPVPKEPEKSYRPTTKGTVRVYRYTSNDRGKLVHDEITEVVTAVERTKAGIVVTVSHHMEGSEFGGTDTFLLSESGLFTTGNSMAGPGIEGERSWKINPPACLLKLPHKDGTEWLYHVPAQPGGLMEGKAIKTAHGPEEVAVPAWKYKAIRVENRAGSNDREPVATFWYAPDVGLVKMVCDGVVQELESVTTKK